MIEHTHQVLGYHRLLDIVSSYASCALGKSECLSIRPSNELKHIKDELKLVSEMRLLLKVKGFVSLADLIDIRPILKKSGIKGLCLDANDFLPVYRLLYACRQSKKFLKSNSSLCPLMYNCVINLPDCGTLTKRIKDTVELNGTVKDSASPALKKLREEGIRLRSGLLKKLERIQQSARLSHGRRDQFVTVRDGRHIIAVRTDQKSRIPGIIHDYSQSRATCFIEPLEMIQDNNRVSESAQKEKTEEFRILTLLTDMVRDSALELELCQTIIGRLDGFLARARYSETTKCVMPEISEKYRVELRRANNPILLAMAQDNLNNDLHSDPPVPVDIILNDNYNVLIISGPNRGGKTVTLKTLGLISLMAQAGIHIPAEEGSCLPVFNQVMAEIGDDQDIQTGQSTFSAHAAHLGHMVEHADEKSLVIIDEPGLGTDPDEGAAIAMAVLDSLSMKDAIIVVSTHFNRLKTYGLLHSSSINASVEFGKEINGPTFRLNYGSPGISHALEIARDSGLSPVTLDRAWKYLDKDELNLNRLIEKLNQLIAEAGHEKKKAEEVKNRYFADGNKLKEKLSILEAEKRDLLKAKNIEADSAIKGARAEFKQAINLLKNNKEPNQAFVADRIAEVSRNLLAQLKPQQKEASTGKPIEIKKGLTVYHKKLKKKGIVLSVIPSGDRARILLGKLKISAKKQDLDVVEAPLDIDPSGNYPSVSWHIKEEPPNELNVIGFRVDDAISLIDKTIDRAQVSGKSNLRIIHGFGTGILRKAIREHLKDVPFAKKFCSAEPKSGGDAITVVELC